MKFIVRLYLQPKGYKICTEEWDDRPGKTQFEPLNTSIPMVFNSYQDALNVYNVLLNNISQELFVIVAVSSGNWNGRVTRQSTEFKENQLINLQQYYENKGDK